MSKREFLEDHPYVSNLLDYAYEHDVYAVTEDLIYEEDIDSHIEDQIREFLNNDSWSRLSSYLDDISTGYSVYWIGDGWFDYRGIDEDDYDEILQMIVDDLGEDYVYGEEEPEEEEEECMINEEALNGLFPIGTLRPINE